jgi:hypothetical protein
MRPEFNSNRKNSKTISKRFCAAIPKQSGERQAPRHETSIHGAIRRSAICLRA